MQPIIRILQKEGKLHSEKACIQAASGKKSALSFRPINAIVIADARRQGGDIRMDKEKNTQFDSEELEKIRRVPLAGETEGEEALRAGTPRRERRGKRQAEEGVRSRRKGSRRSRAREKRGGRERGGGSPAAVFLALMLGIGAGLGGGWYLWGYERPYMVDLKAVEVPQWVEQDFIRKNIYSRPDVTISRVNNIVIHYVANPGSTAAQNRDYFDSLADQDPQAGGTSSSSHFVVGLEGEVIQCIPVDEMAYANAPRNGDTISIENCHPDETGEFTQATYDSLVKLTACLCDQLDLTSEDVVRHYDVNGKECPKYYVDHEESWEQFKKDVAQAQREKAWQEDV